MAPTNGTATSSPIQVILGITLPFLLVASAIPAIMIKRHLEYRVAIGSRIQPMRTTTTPRRLRTSRLPLRSVYLTRVDYYLPATNTTTSFTASMDRITYPSALNSSVPSLPLVHTIPTNLSHMHLFEESFLTLPNDMSLRSGVSAVPSAIPSSVGVGLPSLGSLPSLSSELCEFTAYAEAIDSEPHAIPTDVFRSSTSLLHMAFSTMDVDALSIESLSKVLQLDANGLQPISAMPSSMMPLIPTIQTLASENRVVIEDSKGEETISETGSFLLSNCEAG